MASELAPRRVFPGVSALLLVLWTASATLTIVWCASMSAMGGMPMPGGWTMSMTWMRMPGQTWPGAAASFLGMWIVMMAAMMLPSLAPMLTRYQRAVAAAAGARLGRLTTLVGAGYFFVWLMFGVAAFPLGIALAEFEMRLPGVARAVPIAVGVAVLVVGALQFTVWKARHLACCRGEHEHVHSLVADSGTAWRHGVRLGLDCCHCCGGLMLPLLILGVMNIGVMAIISIAITTERLAPSGEPAAHGIGLAAIGIGLLLVARAAGLG